MDWNLCLRSAPGIDIREVIDGFVVYHPARDRVHFLSPTAAFILQCCDGAVRTGELPDLLAAVFSLERPPTEDIEACLATLIAEGLLLE